MTYKVQIDRAALTFIEQLPKKSQKIVKENLKILKKDPYPGKNGDKKLLSLSDYEIYRIHVGRSFTVFYTINESNSAVSILDIMTIEKAHKKYGRL